MGSSLEGERQSLVVRTTEPEDVDDYTGDGSVGFSGNPILKHETGNWRACSLILGTEVCERLAYYGISKSLVTYLSTRMHEGNVSAARNFTTWQGTCYLTPLIGATLADSYWGKYQTIAVFSTIYFLGMAALTLSALIPSLQPPQCIGSFCPQPTMPQYLIYFVGLYMIALGSGGIKPCVSSFGADQFDDTDPAERTKKGAFFNWFYFAINIGSLISGTVLIWVQQNCGYGIGFGIPTVFIAFAVGSFFIGSQIYRYQIPAGSPLIRVCQVVIAAKRKRNVDLPVDSSLLYELHGKTSAIEGSRKLEHSSEFRYISWLPLIYLLHSHCHTVLSPKRTNAMRRPFNLPIHLGSNPKIEEFASLLNAGTPSHFKKKLGIINQTVICSLIARLKVLFFKKYIKMI